MTIHNNTHSQGVSIQSDQGQDDLQSSDPQKSWGKWLTTPITAIWHHARSFFSWVKGERDPKTVLEPIEKSIIRLRSVVVELQKDNVDREGLVGIYLTNYDKYVSEEVRVGLEKTAAKLLLQGQLRKKAPKKKRTYTSYEDALKQAQSILRRPDNKFFDLNPVFELYLRAIDCKVP